MPKTPYLLAGKSNSVGSLDPTTLWFIDDRGFRRVGVGITVPRDPLRGSAPSRFFGAPKALCTSWQSVARGRASIAAVNWGFDPKRNRYYGEPFSH